MAKAQDNNTTIIPLIGSGILGAGAYGTHKVDKILNDIGISSKMRLNPEALKAFDDYTHLVADPRNPETFAYQYAQAANRAGSAQLFLNDPKKRSAWEWEINNPKFRKNIGTKLERLIQKLDNSPKIVKKLFGQRIDALKGLLGGAKDSLAPLDQYIARQIAEHPEYNLKKVINGLAHVPAMSQSPLDSYVRLLGEIAPDLDRAGGAKVFADNTVEALLNYKNPTYHEYLGRTFETPGDYLNEMHTPKGHKKVKGAFDSYLRSIKNSDKGKIFFSTANPSKETVDLFRHDVAGLLTPESTVHSIDPTGKRIMSPGGFQRELKKVVGSRSVWDATRDRRGVINGIKKIKPASFAEGIKSIQDIRDRAFKNIGLQALDAIATARYSEAAKPYAQLTKAFRVGQFLRNGKLRAGLALGSIGLGGLGITNIIRNRNARKKNESVFNRIISKIKKSIEKR